MKIDRGTFVGPRAPFGYQKSEANHDQLVPDPIASITVRKIFELAANGTGATGIVRYLNEKGLPTPIQYARSNGLTGSFADGTGDWNSRSVKYILTNRTYTGMLIQGKEKRVVKGTHEPLVDVAIVVAIEFFVGFWTFSLITEIILIPLTVLISVLTLLFKSKIPKATPRNSQIKHQVLLGAARI
jgi:hypothetical protein